MRIRLLGCLLRYSDSNLNIDQENTLPIDFLDVVFANLSHHPFVG